uniref:Uncharacterized protein n=1 Tax=Arundo donax TaxID=35708 RepID=A0A0A8YYN5_ARUDO
MNECICIHGSAVLVGKENKFTVC